MFDLRHLMRATTTHTARISLSGVTNPARIDGHVSFETP
jgi:hypothetical protein